MSIYYHKINRYILRILVMNDDCSTFNNLQIYNPLYALYFTKKIYIISIEDFTTNKILTRIEINKNFILEIDNEYVFTEYIAIFKARECAFYYNFIPHKDYELFELGYSGNVKVFGIDGMITNEYTMINSEIITHV